MVIKAPNVHLNLNGSVLWLDPGPGASGSFAVHAPGFEVYGGTIGRAYTFVHSYADKVSLHDLVTTDFVGHFKPNPVPSKPPILIQDSGVAQLYTSDNRMATNNTIEHVHVAPCWTVCVYWSADNMTIKNSVFDGSPNEYDLRQEIPSDGSNILPKGALIDHISADNRINKYGKSALGVRMGSITVTNSSFYSDIRVGQSTAPTTTTDVPYFLFKNNTFFTNHSPQLAIDAGSTGNIESNTFYTSADTYSVAIGNHNVVTLKDNIRKLVGSGFTPKHFVGSNNPASNVIVESGTKIVP